MEVGRARLQLCAGTEETDDRSVDVVHNVTVGFLCVGTGTILEETAKIEVVLW